MALFKGRESQVEKLLDVKRSHDRGKASDEDVLKVVRGSTGHEINEAMDRSGQGTASWARIKGSR